MATLGFFSSAICVLYSYVTAGFVIVAQESMAVYYVFLTVKASCVIKHKVRLGGSTKEISIWLQANVSIKVFVKGERCLLTT